jgi:hypothetical protein
MLMFVFGAGASFDSDPARRPNSKLSLIEREHRPPLAAGLFDPDSYRGKDVVAAFPRAASLIMQLRQATAQGLDVEEFLEQVKLGEDRYSETATQLLALRAYLARLLSEVPAQWTEECQGLTNYVLALAHADRWNVALHGHSVDQPVGCVTFNYDSLLEDAVRRVFGLDIDDIDRYTTHPRVHIYKPHGSVTWRLSADWPTTDWFDGDTALYRAIEMASALEWGDTWTYSTDDRYQDPHDTSTVFLPALSIPVRSKAEFTMPSWHKDAMIEDLRKVTTLVAIGWRARERHFLQLLQDEMPSQPARLVAVAESTTAAQETIDNLWETGRFDSYAVSSLGFSGFAETPSRPYWERATEDRTSLCLQDVLSAGPQSGVWTDRRPGAGLTPDPSPATLLDPGYVDI